jgi:acyl carrier protein
MKKLPSYMIPSFFVQVDEIPLTPNGKCDRKALAAYGRRLEAGVEYVAPTNELERIIAATWKEVLKLNRVGIHDNFFDLGGNSLNIIQVSVRLKEKLMRDIAAVNLFEYPTISDFSVYLQKKEDSANIFIQEANRTETFSKARNRIKKLIKKKENKNEV